MDVVRIQRDQPRVGGERAGVVLQALVAELRDPPEQLAQRARVLRELEPDLEDPYEIPDLVLRVIDLLENGRRALAQPGHFQASLDELARLPIAVVVSQHQLELVERALRVVQLLEEQLADAQPERERVAAGAGASCASRREASFSSSTR